MPVDPNIILGVQNNQIDPGAVMSMMEFAQKLKTQQQATQTQNALRSVFTDPASTDESGLPTSNALKRITAIDPEMGINLYDNVASLKDKEVVRDQHEGDLMEQKSQFYADKVLIPAQTAYQDTLDATGNRDEAIKAGQDAMAAGRGEVDKAGWHSAEELAKHDQSFDPVRVDSQLAQFKDWRDAKKERAAEKEKAKADVRAEAAQAERDKKDDADRAEHISHDRAEEAIANRRVNVTVNNQGGSSGGLDETGIEYAAQKYRETGQMPPLGMGKAAAGIRAAIVERAAELAKKEGTGAAGDVATAADTKANTAGLTNLGKMRASVAQAEGNATREADLTLSLLDKGGLPGGPSALGKWIQGSRTGVFNDPDASAFQTAVESLKNEYVKVLSTQGGMSGGQSSDAARREADSYINPRLSKQQIKANIDVMRKSMKNRTAAIDQAYAETRAKLSGGGKSVGDQPKRLKYDANGNLVN